MPRISAALALGIAVFSRRASATAGEGTCAALLVAERPFMWDAGATAGAAERKALDAIVRARVGARPTVHGVEGASSLLLFMSITSNLSL